MNSNRSDQTQPAQTPSPSLARFGKVVGRTRYAVLVAVVAVLLVAVTLVLLGAAEGVAAVAQASRRAFLKGKFGSTELTMCFLTVIGVMLRAVVFYLIGVGLYSLFIKPLNLTAALGIESLTDLENKVISVVVVILAVTFLQHFIRWENPMEILEYGGGLAAVAHPKDKPQGSAHRARWSVASRMIPWKAENNGEPGVFGRKLFGRMRLDLDRSRKLPAHRWFEPRTKAPR